MTPDEEHTLISNVGQLLTVVENLRSLSPETQKELAADVRKTREDVATISASCLPCQKLIFTHDQVLNGNARPGAIPEKWDGHAAGRIVDVLLDQPVQASCLVCAQVSPTEKQVGRP